MCRMSHGGEHIHDPEIGKLPRVPFVFLVATRVDCFDAARVAVYAYFGGGEADYGAQGFVEVVRVRVVVGGEAGVQGIDVAEEW